MIIYENVRKGHITFTVYAVRWRAPFLWHFIDYLNPNSYFQISTEGFYEENRIQNRVGFFWINFCCK